MAQIKEISERSEGVHGEQKWLKQVGNVEQWVKYMNEAQRKRGGQLPRS